MPSAKFARVCALLVFALNVAACGGAAVQAPLTAQDGGRGPKELSASDIRGVVDAVVSLRGLAEKTKVVVQVVSTEDFNGAFARRRAAIEEERVHAATAEQQSMLPAIPKENPDVYLAFYDELTRVVYMRKEVPEWAAKSTDIRTLLAHEVTHALQDQHFSLLSLRKERDREKVMAFRALIEGDAEVVRIAYDATLRKKPFRRAVAREITDETLPSETLVKMGFFSPALLAVPPQQRDISIFPYISGRNFVARIFLAGGFDAVNALYTHLPTSTEHILHPERYLSGKRPVTLPDVEVPAGFQPSARLTFGELGTRLVLARLAGRPASLQIAAGWAGDRVLLARGATGETLLTWVSFWDDPAKESAFARALIKPNGTSASPSSRRESVRVEGDRVVFVAGLAPSDAEDLVEKLARLPAQRMPAVPPLGSLKLVEPPAPLEQRIPSAPALEGDESGGARFKVAALGLSGRFRAPLIYRKTLRGGFVAASEDGTMLFVQATVAPREASGYEVLHQASVTGFASVLGKTSPQLLANNPDLGAFSRAHPGASARRWLVMSEGTITFQSIIVPICAGNAALVIASGHRTAEGGAQVNQFLADLSIDESSTFCSIALEEERTDLPTPTFKVP